MSDLIDRQMLKADMLCGDNAEHDYCFPCRRILERIDNQPAVQSELRWIPCSEKYPDQGERVLVTIGGYDIWVWDRRANRGDDYFWEDEQGFYHNKYEIDAWMPLPEPYWEDKE